MLTCRTKRFRYQWVALAWITLSLLLSGCTPLVAQSQSLNTTYAILDRNTTLGQTFVAPHDGLTGIEFYLAPDKPADGEIVLHLRLSPDSPEDITSAQLPLQDVKAPDTYRFYFSPVENTRRQYYYAFLEVHGEGSVQVGVAWGYTYLDGSFYQDHNPYDAQLAFSQVFGRTQALVGLFRQGVSWFGIVVIGIFLYILPGWGLLRALWPNWQKVHWAEKTALSAGVSLAIIPLLFLWTDVLHIHLGIGYAWIPGSVALGYLVWINRHNIRSVKLDWPKRDEFRTMLFSHLPDITLIVILVIIVAVRFWPVSNLDLPMWGDSYQHTVLTQLLLNHNGLFDSWEPYAPLQSLTYHYGFHADTALFGWIARIPATRAIIWVGQLLNSIAVLAVYPLAVRSGGNRWAGVLAVLLAGLCFPMPMSYVNWGRYTQLAGQIILPTFALFYWDVSKQEKSNLKSLIILMLLLSGLALTHYRILIFALAVIPVNLLLEVRGKKFFPWLARMAITGAGAGLLFLPWFLRVFGARIMSILKDQMTTLPAANPAGLDQYNSIGNIFSYLPSWAWLSFPLILGIGLWRRKLIVSYIGLWWFIVLLTANPAWLRLPGTGTISNFAVFIAAYIPVSIMIGAAFGWFCEKRLNQPRSASWLLASVIILVIFGIAGVGGQQRLRDVRIGDFALATRPDLNAAAWIRENTPEEAKFVVNYFFAYLDQLIVGSDGGWWLPILTERQTNLPPLTYGIEDSSGDDYLYQTNELADLVQTEGITSPEVLQKLADRGYEYIYIGQRQGKVNNPDPVVLDPQVLRVDGHFKLIYQRDRVWIFKIIP